MTNLIMLEVMNNNTGLNLTIGDKVTVDLSTQPKGNGKDLGVFKLDGEHFISKFTRFGDQLLFIQDNEPIRVIYSNRVETIGTLVESDFEMRIEKAAAVTATSLVQLVN